MFNSLGQVDDAEAVQFPAEPWEIVDTVTYSQNTTPTNTILIQQHSDMHTLVKEHESNCRLRSRLDFKGITVVMMVSTALTDDV